jgi:hypothetical protein
MLAFNNQILPIQTPSAFSWFLTPKNLLTTSDVSRPRKKVHSNACRMRLTPAAPFGAAVFIYSSNPAKNIKRQEKGGLLCA